VSGEPVFFTDRDLGKKFPEILRAAGLKVERHVDHFQHDTPDEEWLREIGRQAWIAITHDGRIRYKPNELATVMQHGVALLVVIGHAPYPELARAFVATVPRILNFIERHEPPYNAKVYRPSPGDIADDPLAPGRIELWHPKIAAKG
jgi:PIN like domain